MNDVCLEELDFENTQLRCENIMLKLDGNLLMLDKAFSMYDYVTKYGVDRSFVKVHNTHYELDALVGMIYPCNESFDGFDVDLANYKQVCMEGILEAITNAVKWVIEKLKALCSWIGEMWDKFWGLFRNKSESNKNKIKTLRSMLLSDEAEFDTEYVSTQAVAKYNEIIQKIESNPTSNAPNGNTEIIPGLSSDEYTKIVDFISNFTTTNKNQHVEKITIKDNAGKDRVLNIADRTTADFEKLIATIGKIINNHKSKITEYEKREQELTKKIAGNKDENAKARLSAFRASIKKYKNTVSVLSKLLKLVLDDTKLTEKMLVHIGKYIKASKDKQMSTETDKYAAETTVNNKP